MNVARWCHAEACRFGIPLLAAAVLVFPMTASAQSHEVESAAALSDDDLAQAVSNSLGPAGVIPTEHGWNASLITSSQHDSIDGWSNVLTPSVAYRFNAYLSVDASTPVLLYLRTNQVAAPPRPGESLPLTRSSTGVQVQHGVVADTFLAAHASWKPFAMRHRTLYDTVTGQLIAPTGSVSDGVGAGKTTWNVTNHLEAGSRWSPFVDLGVGSSSRVQNQRLQQDQTSRGLLANFAAGMRFDLHRTLRLGVEAFEQLPVGSTSISQTAARQGGPAGTGQTSAVAASLAENNGFNTVLDIPIAPRVTLSGIYSRSLRQHEDIAGFSFTFLLRPAAR